MKTGLLTIIVPCYNEEQMIPIFYKEVKQILQNIRYNHEILFVDDGSTDSTAEQVKILIETDPCVNLISFSRNFGKEAGMYAGLSHSKGDLVLIMDADLQHPPRIIPEMIQEIENGYDTVTTKRRNRAGEPWLKNILSRQYYRIVKGIISTEVVQGAQDFRMMKRCVVDAIVSLKEYNRFSKGIFSWVGFKVKYIEIDNEQRVAGSTKWSFWKLFKYAIEGIIAFSTVPLRFATVLGIIISLISFAFLMQIGIQTIIYGIDVPGYASTIGTILFIGGIQLLATGTIAEYIAKMYLEIKNRPKYIIREYVGEKQEESVRNEVSKTETGLKSE